jgi:amidase
VKGRPSAQIVGRHKQDFSVLQFAHAFEKATGFGKKHPAIGQRNSG